MSSYSLSDSSSMFENSLLSQKNHFLSSSKNFNRFLENLQQPTKFVRKLFNKHSAPLLLRHPQEHERFLYGLEAAECIRDHFFPTSPEIVEPNSSTTYDATLITPYELRNCLKDMRKRAAPGPDGIQIQLIIGLKDSIMEPLVLLYNSCLSFGFIPKCMKRAKVILINPLEQRRPPQHQFSSFNNYHFVHFENSR